MSLEAKLLLIEDKLIFFETEMENRIEKECKLIQDRMYEGMKHMRQTPKGDTSAFNSMFDMIKKCIDSQ